MTDFERLVVWSLKGIERALFAIATILGIGLVFAALVFDKVTK